MTAEKEKKEAPKTKETTFKCKFCESSKTLDEMVIITRFFPPVAACRDCERKMR
jgi:transcription elongation factor Elf1